MAMAKRAECPRCGRVGLVGLWRDDPRWPALCGPCKAEVTLTPENKERLVRDIQAIVAAVMLAAGSGPVGKA